MYRILLVEDGATIVQVLERQLHQWGYETAHVTDFTRVMHTFVAFAPHLVLLDISLPFFDGYHWCGEIRKISKAPVLFVSSAADNLNVVMALNLGADDFLAKPFDLSVAVAWALIIQPELVLALFGMSDRLLFSACTAATFLVFAAVYITVYRLTARAYNRLVGA